jgi:hypothetical protein
MKQGEPVRFRQNHWNSDDSSGVITAMIFKVAWAFSYHLFAPYGATVVGKDRAAIRTDGRCPE